MLYTRAPSGVFGGRFSPLSSPHMPPPLPPRRVQVILPTAGADVAFGLGHAGLSEDEAAAAAAAALASVGLEGFSGRPVSTLSGGQRQRVAVAGA